MKPQKSDNWRLLTNWASWNCIAVWPRKYWSPTSHWPKNFMLLWSALLLNLISQVFGRWEKSWACWNQSWQEVLFYQSRALEHFLSTMLDRDNWNSSVVFASAGLMSKHIWEAAGFIPLAIRGDVKVRVSRKTSSSALQHKINQIKREFGRHFKDFDAFSFVGS